MTAHFPVLIQVRKSRFYRQTQTSSHCIWSIYLSVDPCCITYAVQILDGWRMGEGHTPSTLHPNLRQRYLPSYIVINTYINKLWQNNIFLFALVVVIYVYGSLRGHRGRFVVGFTITLSPLKLWVRIPLIAVCTLYSIM